MALKGEPWGEAEAEGATHCCSLMETLSHHKRILEGGGETVVKVQSWTKEKDSVSFLIINTSALRLVEIQIQTCKQIETQI